MRCGECEAAGLVEPCFCPCCGRPLTAGHLATHANGDRQTHGNPDRPCASCGAPTADTGELCARCEEAFQRVLQAATPGGQYLLDVVTDDTPTLITNRVSLDHETAPAPPAVEQVDAADLTPLASDDGTTLDSVSSPSIDVDPPAAEVPKPWWDMPVPVVAPPDPVPAVTLTVETTAIDAPAPLALAPPTPPAEPPPLPAPRAASVPALHAPPARSPRPRPAPRSRRAATLRPRAGRAAALALSAACLCIVGLVGAPHVLDLVWNAPAPAASPAPAPVPEEPVSPLPDTSGLVPATDPSASPEPPPASPGASASAPAKPSEPAKRPARGASRPDASAANRAARLLQQRATSQAKPSTAQETAPAAAMAPLQLPAADAAPPVVAKAAEPTPAVEDLGQAFEVTQVDVRPQVRRQVPPRRPDTSTAADVVVVRVLVSPAGRPADVRIVRGARGAAAYDSAAIDAVKQWTFSPAQKRSRPVSCWVHVGVPFAAAD